jgi:hypothetical protein
MQSCVGPPGEPVIAGFHTCASRAQALHARQQADALRAVRALVAGTSGVFRAELSAQVSCIAGGGGADRALHLAALFQR